jgi:hypothetical protein
MTDQSSTPKRITIAEDGELLTAAFCIACGEINDVDTEACIHCGKVIDHDFSTVRGTLRRISFANRHEPIGKPSPLKPANRRQAMSSQPIPTAPHPDYRRVLNRVSRANSHDAPPVEVDPDGEPPFPPELLARISDIGSRRSGRRDMEDTGMIFTQDEPAFRKLIGLFVLLLAEVLAFTLLTPHDTLSLFRLIGVWVVIFVLSVLIFLR